MAGWSGQILRVDLTNRTAVAEPTAPYTRLFIGGRGVNVKLIFDEVGPGVKPLDPENRLCIGPGALGATPAPAASRSQVTAIVPNGYLASSGIGGHIGAEIRRAGYDNLILQGRADQPVYIDIRDGQVQIKDAGHLWGKDSWEAQQIIRQETGDPDTQLLSIGQAGENQVSFACIMTGMNSAAGHGGFGAVMGSKNLKAIAIRGKRPIEIARLDEFLKTCLEMRLAEQASPAFQAMIASGGKTSAPLGIKAGVTLQGNFESLGDPDGLIKELTRSGDEFWSKYKVGRTGCAGCPVHHFHVFEVPGVGEAGPKCAAWAVFATPIWNTNYEVMFRAGALCNRYGLDFVSTSSIIAFLMHLYHQGIINEKDTEGLAIKRGDPDAIFAIIHKLGRQEGFGRLFRDGVKTGAALIGRGAEELALHIHGREMQVGEFPESNGSALAYAVVKDALDALPIPEMLWSFDQKAAEEMAFKLCGCREAANPVDYEHKARLIRAMKYRTTAAELLGLCKWYLLNLTPSLEVPAKLFSLATGLETTEKDLLEAAERISTLERAVNVSRGQRRIDDTLPKRIFETPVPGGLHKGRFIDREKFDGMVGDFYALSGWDEEGVPKEETFRRVGLELEWPMFQQRMGRGS